MRLSDRVVEQIRIEVAEIFGGEATVRIFGSRVDNNRLGGDLDLMVELLHPLTRPALKASKLSAKISRLMYGRKVDVLISAPNLQRLPIHEVAQKNGVLL